MIRVSRTAIAFAFMLGLPTAAFAEVTAEEIGNRLNQTLQGQDFKLIWDSIEGSGSDYTLKGVKVANEAVPQGVALGDVQLSNVTELDGGDYRVGDMTLPNWQFEQAGMTIAMNGMRVGGLPLVAPGSSDPLAGYLIGESMQMKAVTISSGGKNLFLMSNVNASSERSNEGRDLAYVTTAEQFSSDLSGIESPSTKAMLEALQLLKIDGRMSTRGTWSLESGIAEIQQFDIDVANQGKISLATKIGGYTEEFLKSMRELQKNAANATPEQQQAQGMAALGLLQQLTLGSASVRYDDATFAMRALEVAAATQNARAADLPATAQMLAPMMLGQYLPDDMVQPVTAELVKFLKDPKNFEIKIAPAQPLPMMMLGGVAIDPKSTIKALNLTVTANQ